MNLLLLFIFMNSCHLAQCEMMGHSRATRRAGSEFTITHTDAAPHPQLLFLSPLSSPYSSRLDLLNMDGTGRMEAGIERDADAEKERERTFL